MKPWQITRRRESAGRGKSWDSSDKDGVTLKGIRRLLPMVNLREEKKRHMRKV